MITKQVAAPHSSLLYAATHLALTHRCLRLKCGSPVDIAQMQTKIGRVNNYIQQDD